jgi:hypothetical protein
MLLLLLPPLSPLLLLMVTASPEQVTQAQEAAG